MQSKDGFFLKFLTIILAPFAMAVFFIDGCHREKAKEAFESGSFAAIAFFEDNDALQNLLSQKCRNAPKSLMAQIKEDDSQRKFYTLPKTIQHQELPKAKYLVVYPQNGQEVFLPIYDIFTGSKAADKARSWLKNNGYSFSDFPLEWENSHRFDTVSVRPVKGESQIQIIGYLEVGSKLYLWNGGMLTNTAQGHSGFEDYSRQYLEAMLKLAH